MIYKLLNGKNHFTIYIDSPETLTGILFQIQHEGELIFERLTNLLFHSKPYVATPMWFQYKPGNALESLK